MALSHCYWHLVGKNGNFTLLVTSSGQEWQFHMTNASPSESRIDDLNTATPNLADKPTFANGPPKWIKIRWLEYCYTKLGRQTYFGKWTQLVLTSSGQDVFKFGRYTPRSAGKSTCLKILRSSGHKCNFILQLISSGEEWQFHIATHI